MNLISLNNITIRIRDKFLFRNTSLKLQKADNLLVVGANGSGKTTLVKAIAGLLPVSQGEITLDFLDDPLPYPSVHKNKIAYVSFDAHKKIHLENEFKKDIEDFTGVSQKILNLSTGQTRKYLIEKALEKNPAILILDEPFDGLDESSRWELKKLIDSLVKKVFVILVTHRVDEVINGIKKAVLVKDGRIEKFGKSREILKEYQLFTGSKKSEESTVPKKNTLQEAGNNLLIDFKNVSTEFGGKKILQNINWQVNKGEHWAIVGPNGSGKSTLVKLITGENLQVFGADAKIFGKSRSEIGIDEIRRRIGLVSSDLGLRIHDHVLVSKIVANSQVIKKLGIASLVDKKYGELSFGQKRMVLVARALDNTPEILVLDEPTHGLDSRNRKLVLEEIDKIAKNGTTVILITHHKDEIISSINRVMHLKSGRIEKISDLG